MSNDYKTIIIQALSEISELNEAKKYKERGVSVAAVAINIKDPSDILVEVNSKGRDEHAESKVIKQMGLHKKWILVVTTSPCPDCQKLINEMENIVLVRYLINNVRTKEFCKDEVFDLSVANKKQLELIEKYLEHFVKHQNKFKKHYSYTIKLNWEKSRRFFSTIKDRTVNSI